MAFSFNPWYVGGGVKRLPPLQCRQNQAGFNPWYVGGGVKSPKIHFLSQSRYWVSILGMLEGVLKGKGIIFEKEGKKGFNPWYVGGGVKSLA